jgi:hypothetical protein
MSGKIPNPYLAAIKARRQGSHDAAETLRTVLDAAVTAMDNGAWTGGKADGFYAELTGQRTDARTAATRGIAEFDDAISDIVARGDEMVDPDSWYVHWHNLR